MAQSRMTNLIAAVACLTTVSLSFPASAIESACKWGGDESQSMRCFDCMRRVWTGHEWKLVNTCRPRYFNDFAR